MLRGWIAGFLQRCFVHDLPPELTYCEVGCRRSDCTLANFASCGLRDAKAPPPGPSLSDRVVPLRSRRPAASSPTAADRDHREAMVSELRDHPRFRARLQLQRYF